MEYIVFTFYSEIVLLVGIRGSKHRILRGQMGDPAVNFLSFNFFTFYDKGGMEIRLKWVRKFVEIIIFNIVVKRKKRIKEIRIPQINERSFNIKIAKLLQIFRGSVSRLVSWIRVSLMKIPIVFKIPNFQDLESIQ